MKVKNKSNDFVKLVIAMLLSFLIGGLSTYYFVQNNNGTNPVKTPNGETTCKACANTVIVEEGSLSAAVDKVYNSVVQVQNYQNSTLAGTGSGFVYKQDKNYSYLLTNHHVVEKGTKFSVVNALGETIDATLLGSDEYLDLAVLRIALNTNMPALTVADMTKLKTGDQVMVVGSPVGDEYFNTVTNGIISGLNRLVEVSLSSGGNDWVMEVIQTNAAVNPGNSGGPMFNAKGELIGIISMKLVDSTIEGMGFAIPIDYALSHIDKLEKGQKIDRPLLGITMTDTNTSAWTLRQYGITIDSNIDSGVVVIEVQKDSGAAKSNLTKGDVITELNGEKIKNVAYLKYLLYKYNPGDEVELTYYRNNKFLKTKITLTKNDQ